MPGDEWSADDADLGGHEITAEVRSALLVNLLTEDNLPYYFRTVERMFGQDGAWGDWVRRWTAEEGRHSMAIYGYLMATRAIDPVELERSRMVQVSRGRPPTRDDCTTGSSTWRCRSWRRASPTATPACRSATRSATR